MQSGVTINQGQHHVRADENIRPLRDNIVLKPLDWDASQVILAVRTGRPVRGQVIAAGPGCYPKIHAKDRSSFRYSDVFRPTEVEVGDVVELGGLNAYDGRGYVFTEIVWGNDLCIQCSEQDVAVVRDDLKAA